MRIYTEVIFEWDEAQGKLVEVSSKSEEYSGRVDLAQETSYSTDEYYADSNASGTYDIKVRAKIFNNADGSPASYTIVTTEESGNERNHIKGIAYSSEEEMNNKIKESAASLTARKWPNDNQSTNYVLGGSFGSNVSAKDQSLAGQNAENALKGLTEEWARIKEGDSEFQRAVTSSFDTLTRGRRGGCSRRKHT